ncbi:unnamed protein product [marine sediment metagenome]|uniref:DNA-directed DNA polymerase family A palm domain-containing protein n=1 Tax=marine sediment metagenome TaxID=412755 RepID=X1TE45_9ZZZZ
MVTLEKAWIIIYKLHDEIKLELCKSKEEFCKALDMIADEKGYAEDICCLVPNDFFLPFYVER